MAFQPAIPVPPSLRGSEAGSFAEDTIRRRLPEIGQRVLTENSLEPGTHAAVTALLAEIPLTSLRPLTDKNAPDFNAWQSYITPNQNKNWLEVPWFLAETYFYRRIITAVDYFNTGFDPYHFQKEQGLLTQLEKIGTLSEQLAAALPHGWQPADFQRLLAVDLWGNQADLSLWTAAAAEKPDHADDDARQSHLLIDGSQAAAQYLAARENLRLDFIIDNAGLELVGDLILGDYLLTTGKADQIHFHLKLHPTFVSDVVYQDINTTLDFLSGLERKSARELAQRLSAALANGRLQLHAHPFWTSPLPMWQMPADLRQTLAAAALVISKGDANYRRALGDARWPYDTPASQVISYFPAPILCLRTCKSDVLVGLDPGRRAVLDVSEPGWDTNGRWGIMQWIP